MQTLSNIFGFTSLAAFAVGFVWLVVQAFRRNIWWGIFTVILFPIAVFIFPFVSGRRALKPVLLIIGSIVLVYAAAATQEGATGGIAIGGLTFAAAAYGYIKSRNSARSPAPEAPSKLMARQEAPAGHIAQPGIFDGFRRRIIKSAQGIIFDSRRFEELVRREHSFFGQWGGLPRVKAVAKLFDNVDLINDVHNFNQKHFSTLLEDKAVSAVKWQDERCQLFLEMMKKKYRLNEPEIVSILLYVNDEEAYAQYASTFDESIASDPRIFLREVVLSNIYTGRQPNFRYIARLADDVGVRFGRQPVEQQYDEVRQEIKLLQFEKNLGATSPKSYQSIEQQIKTEKQLEAISSRISNLLSLEPTDYIITGPDYSRDSRIDSYYKTRFSYVLSKAFGGHCCRCNEGMGQLEFDHFWWPKSRGGNFLMRSNSGVYVNNCIPLCRSCNSSKSNKDFREFFTEEEIARIIEISQSINAYINEQMIDFEDRDFVGRTF